MNDNVKIFADGASVKDMIDVYKLNIVQGFTTNPTLMKKANVTDYVSFAKEVTAAIPDLPISFEVFTDDISTMELEARKIATWGNNVYVKIPITNTKGESMLELVEKLSSDGIKINVTAILTLDQVERTVKALNVNNGAYVSVFAGRIADTGVNPLPTMKIASEICHEVAGVECLWASTRELYNLFQAREANVDIITMTNDVLKKMSMIGLDLNQLSLDTVKMFYDDAVKLGYNIL